MMTSRERLRRCFFCEELDRPGIFCRGGFPAHDPSYDPLRHLLSEETELKSLWPAMAHLAKPEMVRTTESYSDDFFREIGQVVTPAGPLTQIQLFGLKNQPGMVEKHLLADRHDAEKYLSLPLPPVVDKPDHVNSFFSSEEEIGDRGIAVVWLGCDPAGQVVEMFGSENFAMMSITDRDILHALCERQMKIHLNLVDYLLSRRIGPFFALDGQEYLVPPLHGRTDFYDFAARYDKPILDRLRGSGGRVHVHCHGSIKTVLDGFLDMRIDVLHPFEAPPMGDITAREAKEKIRGKMCMEGNIQIADFYEKSPDQIREQTDQLIRDVFGDHLGLIVCPTASPYIFGAGERCLRQFEAMIDTVLNWRS